MTAAALKNRFEVSPELLGKLVSTPESQKSLTKFKSAFEAEEELSARVFGVTSKDFSSAFSNLLRPRGPSFAGLPEEGEAPEDLEEAAETASDCAAKIASYGSSAAAVLGAAGSAAFGIGALPGAIIGWIGGALVAAWECGALAWLREAFEGISEFFTEIFNPKPDEFQTYVDVAGPAVRRTNFTIGPEKEERMFVGMLWPFEGKRPPAIQNVVDYFNTRITGTKVTPIEAKWLLRRTMELGGGAEEFATLNRILNNDKMTVERSRMFFDRVSEVLKASPEDKALASTFAKFKKAFQFDALRRGGYRASEARKEVYGKERPQDNLELIALQGLLKKYLPGPSELAERDAAQAKVAKLPRVNFVARVGSVPAPMAAAISKRIGQGPSGGVFTASQSFPSSRVFRESPPSSESSEGPPVALIALVAVGALLLLRK